jgi:beta-lactam-binding protein with PASTA domain
MQVAYRHVHESVPEPTSVSPQLPAAFDPVVLEATHHDPDRRLPDAGALLADLHAAQARVPAGGLDVRAADAATLRLDADRTELMGVTGAPAAASQAQPTRALAAPRRESRAGGTAPRATTAPAARPGGPLVPRLKVHDDEPAPPGFLGDRRRQGLAAITGALVLVLAIFGGIWWFTGGPGAYIKAPSLVGERVTDAKRILATNGLGNQVKSVFSTKVASGQVISSDPGGGENVKKNGVVVLTVSKGPQLFAVPDVVGLTTADATDKIKKANLTVDTTVKKDFSPTVPKGKVISTSPEAKTKIAPDREVTLTVSKGPEPVLLDNVVGQQVDAAKALLKNKGFEVKVEEQPFVNGSGNPGTVVKQDPAVQTEGQTASVGSTITLTVIGQPQLLNVPDVRGQSFDQAVQTLNNAGFQHIRREGNQFFGDTVRDQNVFGQQPADTQIVLKTRF